MGGSVEVSSKLGVGTTFSVFIKTKCFKQQNSFIEPDSIEIADILSLGMRNNQRFTNFESIDQPNSSFCFLKQKSNDRSKMFYLVKKQSM